MFRVNFLFTVRSHLPPAYTAAHKRPQSFCQKCRWQVTAEHSYTLDAAKLRWADCTVQAWSGNPSQSKHRVATHHCPGIEWEPITAQA